MPERKCQRCKVENNSQQNLKSKPIPYQRVAILGMGLMGGSLGLALRERRLTKEVVGYNRSPDTLKLALDRGAVDRICHTPEEAVKGADLVVLAVPIKNCRELVVRCLEFFAPGTVITDLGSTKEFLVNEISEILPDSIHYIGGHPMTGSEEAGIKAAEPALWENAIYVLTPDDNSPKNVVEGLKGLIEGIGAQPLLLSPPEHDRLVALVSHLPHLAAVSLVMVAESYGNKDMIQTLAAGGFRDTTRVAMGNPDIWRDICSTNRDAIDYFLNSYITELEFLRRVIGENHDDDLEGLLHRAKKYRLDIPRRGRGILPELFEVMALVKDTPGVIGSIATLLGEEGVNISSIEILHVREEEGGSVKLGFRDEVHWNRAVDVLRENGYKAYKR